MVVPLPDVPDLNWFELEIMFYLMGARRYGNELRLLLNDHLGEDTVTTGKLYPYLKKLEKLGYIKRLKMKKSDIEKMETGMRHLLTRGVERNYFEITEEGMAAVNKAIHFSSFIHYHRSMGKLHGEIREIIEEIIRPLGNELTIGVLSSPTKQGIGTAVEMLPEFTQGDLIFLLMGSKKDLNVDLSSEFDVDVTSFPCKYDDIPLKSNYLDSAVSFVHLHDVSDPKKMLKELVRTVKPGGQFILVDLARADSLILEDIFRQHADISRNSDYRGEDIEELREMLEDMLVKVHIRRRKELSVLYGRKKKRNRKGTDNR
jgi:DNA-binding PadR family transcriptional regulator